MQIRIVPNCNNNTGGKANFIRFFSLIIKKTSVQKIQLTFYLTISCCTHGRIIILPSVYT